MNRLVCNANGNIGTIERYYFSRGINECIYKIIYYDYNGNFEYNHYEFLTKDTILPLNINTSDINWKTVEITNNKLDGYTALLKIRNSYLKGTGNTSTDAFDGLVDNVNQLLMLSSKSGQL